MQKKSRPVGRAAREEAQRKKQRQEAFFCRLAVSVLCVAAAMLLSRLDGDAAARLSAALAGDDSPKIMAAFLQLGEELQARFFEPDNAEGEESVPILKNLLPPEMSLPENSKPLSSLLSGTPS